MLISDQAKDLVKNCLKAGTHDVSFSTAGLNPGSWINRLCKSRKVLETCDDEENLELYHVFNIAVENEW